MAGIINGKGKKIFFDFGFLENLKYKTDKAPLNALISKLNIQNVSTLKELTNFLENTYIENGYICLVSNKERIIKGKQESNVKDVIVRFSLNETSQKALEKGVFLGIYGDINADNTIIKVTNIFTTRMSLKAMEFETEFRDAEIKTMMFKSSYKEEYILQYNILNSQNIGMINNLLSTFETEQSKWKEYLSFCGYHLKNKSNCSVPYLSQKHDYYLKIETKKMPNNLINFRDNSFKSNEFSYFDLTLESKFKSNNINYEKCLTVTLDCLFMSNENKYEKLKKFNELSIVPFNANKEWENILRNEDSIFNFNFNRKIDSNSIVNVVSRLGYKDEKIDFYEYIEMNHKTFYGNKQTFKNKHHNLVHDSKEWFIRKISFEVDDNFKSNLKLADQNFNLNNGYIAFTGIGEEILLERMRNVLRKISEGQSKNPYLVNYLFNTKLIELSDDTNGIKLHDSDFHFNLNNEQKETVTKALNSKDVFLIQGPPGTGKTQVICEIVAQLSNANKKVLVSSQNHEAIKNVLDRLPVSPNINKIRLSNSYSAHSFNKFAPEFSILNYYKYIGQEIFDKMDSQNSKLEEFQEIRNKLEKLVLSSDGVHESLNRRREISNNISKIDQDIFIEQQKIINFDKKQTLFENEKYYIELIVENFIVQDFNIVISNEYEKINYIFDERELELEYFVKLVRVRNGISSSVKNDDDFLSKLDFISKNIIDANSREEFNLFINDMVSDFKNKLHEISLEKSRDDKKLIEDKINILTNKKNELRRSKIDINEFNINIMNEISNLSNELNNRFNLNINGLDPDFQTIAKNKLNDLENDIKNKIKIKRDYSEIYEDTIAYLKLNYNIEKDDDKDIDKIKFSKQMISDINRYSSTMFDKMINIYAMTLTSADKFKLNIGDSINDMSLEEINVKNMDVDTVIIDEASKATILEILMPLMYGKNLILVGDYRQLPPTLKLQEKDIEDVNENYNQNFNFNILNDLINDSAFKNLIASNNRNITSMLKVQYRSHENIMDVVNHFYDNQLTVLPEVSASKEHNLKIKDRIGNNLIDNRSSVYWVDSSKDLFGEISYEQSADYSNSLYNELEIALSIELIKKINDSVKKLNLKTKPSLAWISFYALHVRMLKSNIKKIKKQLTHINLIINTVDDFQGKEADYVIVNMVRNPKSLSNESGREFLKRYERINVAFSRARKLLIIVGATRATNDLLVGIPDINNPIIVNNKNVYEEIYSTLLHKNAVLKPNDIIEE